MTRDKYVKINNALVFKSRTEFLKTILEGKKVKMLDVGNLGDGQVNVDVKNLVINNNGEYYGLDCNENLSKALNKNNQFIGDLHNLSEIIESESFDCIYAGQVIEHSWSPGKMIKECYRILRNDGYLILDTPHVYDLVSIARLFLIKKDTVGMDDNTLAYHEAKDNFLKYRKNDKNLLSQPQHKIFYSPAMLRQLLNMHGFEVKNFVFISKPKNFFHKILLKIFPQGSQGIGVVAKKSNLESIFNINDN